MSTFLEWERNLTWSEATLALLVTLTLLWGFAITVYNTFRSKRPK